MKMVSIVRRDIKLQCRLFVLCLACLLVLSIANMYENE